MSHLHLSLIQKVLLMGVLLALAGIALVVLGVSVGSTGLGALSNFFSEEIAKKIIWEIRLPRSLGAYLAGALLGLAGAVAQGLFRNPLADPYLLGSASGATLAVAVNLVVVGGSPFAHDWFMRIGLTGSAFIGAVLAVLLTLLLAQGTQHTLRLLLSGVIVGVVLGAFSTMLTLFSPNILQTMQAFMLGSTGFIGWSACVVMVAALSICLVGACVLSRVLDSLTLGEMTAASLGFQLRSMKILLIVIIALSTGAAVAQVGLIAFVGLVAPHLVRSLIHVSYRGLIVLSTLMGGVLLLLADVIARVMIAPQELPVGILTAALGGSYLLWLMYRNQSRGSFL